MFYTSMYITTPIFLFKGRLKSVQVLMSLFISINHLAAWLSRQDSNISRKFSVGPAGYCFSFSLIESLDLPKVFRNVGFPALKFGNGHVHGSTSLASTRYVDLRLVVLTASLGVFLEAAFLHGG